MSRMNDAHHLKEQSLFQSSHRHFRSNDSLCLLFAGFRFPPCLRQPLQPKVSLSSRSPLALAGRSVTGVVVHCDLQNLHDIVLLGRTCRPAYWSYYQGQTQLELYNSPESPFAQLFHTHGPGFDGTFVVKVFCLTPSIQYTVCFLVQSIL